MDIEFSVMGNEVSQQSYTKSVLGNDLWQNVYWVYVLKLVVIKDYESALKISC